jgi:hypothetical protein
VTTPLVPAGSALENPYVYDSVARELKDLARDGRLEVVTQEWRDGPEQSLIGKFAFKRLR